MAASASAFSSLIYRVSYHLSSPNGGRGRLFVGHTRPALLPLRAPPPTVALARRNKKSSSSTAKKGESTSKIKKAQPLEVGEEDDIDEDAFEALFDQLEEDLKNDLSEVDGDDEITEDDMAKLEQELEEALGDVDFDELQGGLPLNSDFTGDDESDKEERPPKLKNWQIKRLAYALKIGRRKTSIKSLAAELGLDRALVLELLRDPPPHLLLMSASLPDKVSQTTSELETKPVESSPELADSTAENEPDVQEPVHVKQARWFMQKRLKKVHAQTLERVYSRTKRPTNAMMMAELQRSVTTFRRSGSSGLVWDDKSFLEHIDQKNDCESEGDESKDEIRDLRPLPGIHESNDGMQWNTVSLGLPPKSFCRKIFKFVRKPMGTKQRKVMAELQRSVTTFRRSGSSGLVWDDRWFLEDSDQKNDGESEGDDRKEEVRELRPLQGMRICHESNDGMQRNTVSPGLPPKSFCRKVFKFIRKPMGTKQPKVSSY